MPGYFNDDYTEDGGVSITAASDKVGFFALNQSSAAPPPGTPGGAGVFGVTTVSSAAGVFGANNSALWGADGKLHGVGVQGNGPDAGVSGYSHWGNGTRGITSSSVSAAVLGINTAFDWTATFAPHLGAGVFGVTQVPFAAGVVGVNTNAIPWEGRARGAGIFGVGPEAGVVGTSGAGSGVIASSERGQGISAFSRNDIALFAQGAQFAGVFRGAVVVDKGPDPEDQGIAPSPINGSIVINEGSLFVNNGDVILGNGDCAEDFDVADEFLGEPGAIMVLNDRAQLEECTSAYDTRVVGVVSGAGSFKPAMVLDRKASSVRRLPVALMGKVYCKVDAQYGPIKVGDLITTSPTIAHGMRAADSAKAFGAVLGKSLGALSSGRGLIPILVTLQ